MNRLHRCSGAAAAVVTVLCVTAHVRAARAPIENVALEYHAPDACPSEDAFTRQVRARTARVRFVKTGADRRFLVSIEARASTFAGRLEIIDHAGQRSRRRFKGRNCGEVASALALVTALAVDPKASTAPASELVLPAASSVTAHRSRPTAPREARVRPRRARWRWSSGVDVTATAGPASRPLVAPAPFVGTERQIAGPWKLGFRLQAVAAETGWLGPEAPRARYRWFAARFELCPLAWDLSKSIGLTPCATSDAGVVVARGTDVALPRSATRGWWSAGLSARLSWRPTSGVFVEIGGDALAAITRDDFVFEKPHITVHRVPPMSFGAEIGAGVNFL